MRPAYLNNILCDDSNRHMCSQYDEQTWRELEHHNNRIYHNFDFFVKVTIAIVGGLAYIAINPPNPPSKILPTVVRLGAILELLVGVVAIMSIYFHQKSKIKRWVEKPEKVYRAMWAWQETWLCIAILISALVVACTACCIIAPSVNPQFGECMVNPATRNQSAESTEAYATLSREHDSDVDNFLALPVEGNSRR